MVVVLGTMQPQAIGKHAGVCRAGLDRLVCAGRLPFLLMGMEASGAV